MTKIEWVRGSDGRDGESWNALRAVRSGTGPDGQPWSYSANHCEHVNEACRWCYAERGNRRLNGLPFKPGHRKDYTFVVDQKKLTAPLRWKRPRRIFVESMSDAFGEWWPDEFIDQLYTVMALTPRHTYINLSKRPERRRTYLAAARAHPVGMAAFEMVLNDHAAKENSQLGASVILQGDVPHLKVWPLPNVIEGTSVSNQEEADEFVPILLQTPAALRCVSAEPLLGPIDFSKAAGSFQPFNTIWWDTETSGGRPPQSRGISWIIIGGESGDHARPMHPKWARDIRDQCQAAGVPFFFKQWGEWAPSAEIGFGGHEDKPTRPMTPYEMVRVGKKAAGRLLDGVEHNGFPEMPR